MRFLIAGMALTFIAASAVPGAAALSDEPRGSLPRRAFGPASVFASPASGTAALTLRPLETLRLAGERVETPAGFAAGGGRGMTPGAGGSRITGAKAALAVVSSAIPARPRGTRPVRRIARPVDARPRARLLCA